MRKVALWALCLALPTVAHAIAIIDLQLASPLSAPNYAFYSYVSTAATGSQVETNIPVGPYIAYLTTVSGGGPGTTFNNQMVYAFCFDFNAPTNVGTAYAGSFDEPPPTDQSDLEATFLMHELDGLGGINAPLATRGAISTAIWQIMNPSSATTIANFPDDPAAQPWITLAQNATAPVTGTWTATLSAGYSVWLPQTTGVQRFGLVIVPEPGSLVLMGLGILGLAVMAGRKSGGGTL